MIGLAASSPSLLSRKTRLTLGSLSVGAHVAVVIAFALASRQVAVLAPINIDVIPQGDYVVDTVAVAGTAAVEPEEQRQVRAPDPEPQPPDIAGDKPPVESAIAAPTMLAADPKITQAELEAKTQQQKREARKRAEEREKLRMRRLQEQRRRQLAARRDETRDADTSRQGGSEAHRAGVANGQALRAARISYGAIISAELNRHKAYPPSARARGEMGSVAVRFTVGGSGRIIAHSIYRSSGYPSLDNEVHSMMGSAHAPPPPNGYFQGAIVINFNLNH